MQSLMGGVVRAPNECQRASLVYWIDASLNRFFLVQMHLHCMSYYYYFDTKQSGVPGSGPDNGAAIMKGPMAVKVVSQL